MSECGTERSVLGRGLQPPLVVEIGSDLIGVAGQVELHLEGVADPEQREPRHVGHAAGGCQTSARDGRGRGGGGGTFEFKDQVNVAGGGADWTCGVRG